MADYNLSDIPNRTHEHTRALYLATNDIRVILREKLKAHVEEEKALLSKLREQLNHLQNSVRESESKIQRLEREYFDVAHSILK